MRKESQGWVIDKHVPVAVILALLLQLCGAIIWATQLDARVNRMEKQNAALSDSNEKFARLEERLGGLQRNLDTIRHQLDYLTERLIKK